jgi:hypothetical protein
MHVAGTYRSKVRQFQSDFICSPTDTFSLTDDSCAVTFRSPLVCGQVVFLLVTLIFYLIAGDLLEIIEYRMLVG